MPHLPSSSALGIPFIELQSVDSTNNYAMAKVHASLAQHGMAIFAHDQQAGKGQRGRTWLAEAGNNINLSLILQPGGLQARHLFGLNTCVAVGVYRFFSQYAGDETRIKWPNDIYWRDRKAAGILIENIMGGSGQWQWAIAGIGININQSQFSPTLKNPVSLRQITGKQFDPVLLAKELCGFLNETFHVLQQGNFQDLLNEYNRHLYKKNASVKFRKANRNFSAIVKSVEADGRLLVEHGMEEQFQFGELEWLL